MSTLNWYQEEAEKTAVYPDKGGIGGLTYAVLGLVGEAGELANKLKKHIRNGTKPDKDVLLDELGDVLWYVSAVASEFDENLSRVASNNLEKLRKRAVAGELKNHG